MNDYDVFVVPSFILDSNYNYDIKLITSKEFNKQEVLDNFTRLGIEEDRYSEITSKKVYYINLSCLKDIKKWLNSLVEVFNKYSIRSNLDSKLLDKVKEVKK